MFTLSDAWFRRPTIGLTLSQFFDHSKYWGFWSETSKFWSDTRPRKYPSWTFVLVFSWLNINQHFRGFRKIGYRNSQGRIPTSELWYVIFLTHFTGNFIYFDPLQTDQIGPFAIDASPINWANKNLRCSNFVSVLVQNVDTFHDFILSHQRNIHTIRRCNGGKWNVTL